MSKSPTYAIATKLLQELFEKKKVSGEAIPYLEATFLPALIRLVDISPAISFSARSYLIATYLSYVQSFIDYGYNKAKDGDDISIVAKSEEASDLLILELTQALFTVIVHLSSSISSLIAEDKAASEKSVIKDTVKKTPHADKIINQVFVDELACDLGDYVIKYKKSTEESIKNKIKQKIEEVLKKYNAASNQTPLTFDDVVKDQKEGSND